jgi:hypothetical protein
MITLYTFGPYFGLPDGSPFVIKAMLLLKFAGLEYSENRGGYGKAPKGKLPYINDGGLIVADSTFVRFHIEKKYGFDFDAGSRRNRGQEPGRPRKCARNIFISLWWRRAGSITPIFCQGAGPILQNRANAPPADRAKPSCPQSCKDIETTRVWAPYASRAGRPRDCRHQCACFPFRGQGFFDGRKALRGGCDGLRLRRELSHAGVRDADPYRGGAPPQPRCL